MKIEYTELLLYFVPALLVLVTAFFLIKKFLDDSYKLKLLEVRKASQKDILPLRLQAYERLCLFLERITPVNMIPRVHQSGMTAKQLQSQLLTTVRTEFEHNLSQQLYVSSAAWEAVKNAKEDVVKLVNSAVVSTTDNASALDLSKAIFSIVIRNETSPTQKAIDFLKQETRSILGA